MWRLMRLKVILLCLLLSACSDGRGMRLNAVSWRDIPGWQDDNFIEAFTDYWNNVIDYIIDDCSDAIEESKTQVKVNLITATACQRKVALQFQRSFEKLDDRTANEIMKILNKEET